MFDLEKPVPEPPPVDEIVTTFVEEFVLIVTFDPAEKVAPLTVTTFPEVDVVMLAPAEIEIGVPLAPAALIVNEPKVKFLVSVTFAPAMI